MTIDTLKQVVNIIATFDVHRRRKFDMIPFIMCNLI